MSGTREMWPQGYPIFDADLQRMSNQAAAAADEVFGAITAPGGVWAELGPGPSFGTADRTILPLLEEGQSSILHQLLVVPSSTNGKVTVRPALYQRAATGSSGAASALPDLVARQTAPIDSAAFAANASGNPRIDLVYATIQRATSVTAQRPYRDNGGVSTPTLTLADAPAVTITILQGTPGASPSAPALPADGGSSWNFALAQVTVPNGYALNGAVSSSNVAQVWIRGGVHQELMRPVIGGDAVDNVTPALLSGRFGPVVRAFCPVKHTGATVTKALLLASQYDGRLRRARFSGFRMPSNAGTAPQAVTAGGVDTNSAFDSGMVWTGSNGAVGTPCYVVTPGAKGAGGAIAVVLTFWADSSTGALNVQFSAVGPVNGGGDVWWIEVELSGSASAIR